MSSETSVLHHLLLVEKSVNSELFLVEVDARVVKVVRKFCRLKACSSLQSAIVDARTREREESVTELERVATIIHHLYHVRSMYPHVPYVYCVHTLYGRGVENRVSTSFFGPYCRGQH